MGAAEPQLARVLGFWQVTASGVGIIIGAGIYVLVGAATAEAGSAVWASFVLAGVLSALTGLSYAELASMYPAAGAEFEYARQAFNDWLAKLVGWAMIMGLVVAAAAVALGFARYLQHFVDVNERAAAAGLIVATTLIALTGIRNSAALTLVLSSIQVGGLIFVIAVGADHVGDVSLVDGFEVNGVLAGAALVFFAFIGFDEVITMAEETRDPSRTVPRALLTALAISTVLYVAVGLVAVSVLGAPAVADSERPLAAVIDHAFGGTGAAIVSVAALVSTTNTALLAQTAASRVSFGMAEERALPGPLARVSERTSAPWVAVLVCGGIALVLTQMGGLAQLARLTDAAVYAVFLAVNAAVIKLRFSRPAAPRAFRTPWSVGRLPILPVLGFVTTLGMLSRLHTETLVAAGIAVAVGLAVVGGQALIRRGEPAPRTPPA